MERAGSLRLRARDSGDAERCGTMIVPEEVSRAGRQAVQCRRSLFLAASFHSFEGSSADEPRRYEPLEPGTATTNARCELNLPGECTSWFRLGY